jgi:hypothetical protein
MWSGIIPNVIKLSAAVPKKAPEVTPRQSLKLYDFQISFLFLIFY